MVKVLIIQSERGWGQKVDEVKTFATYEEGQRFCSEYMKNITHQAPFLIGICTQYCKMILHSTSLGNLSHRL